MAKQSGLHKIRGKVGEHSYYKSKVGGYQIRAINSGMSARVRTAPEFANTRLNNAEFGMLGNFAGKLISPIVSRWRFILNPIAVGDLVKMFKPLLALDSTHPWGERILGLTAFPTIQGMWNDLSKNSVPDFMRSYFENDVTYNVTNQQVSYASLKSTMEYEQQMMNAGATGVQIYCFIWGVRAPTFTNGAYQKAVSVLIPVNNDAYECAFTGSGDHSIITAQTKSTIVPPVNDTTHVAGHLAVIMPYRQVGSVINTLQQYCSACWYSLVQTGE